MLHIVILWCMGYTAPECLINGEVSFKADIFSLGVIIKQLLIGNTDLSDFDEVRKQCLIIFTPFCLAIFPFNTWIYSCKIRHAECINHDAVVSWGDAWLWQTRLNLSRLLYHSTTKTHESSLHLDFDWHRNCALPKHPATPMHVTMCMLFLKRKHWFFL